MPFQVNTIQRTTATSTSIEESRQSSGNSPFESFLTAAFGTFLAVLLAWRFLLSNDSPHSTSDEQQRSITTVENKHTRNDLDDSSPNSSTKQISTTTTTATSTGVQPCRRSLDGIKNEFDNRHASVYITTGKTSTSSPSSSSIFNTGESSSQRPLSVQRLNSTKLPLSATSSTSETASITVRMDVDNNSQYAKSSDDSGTETDFVDLSTVVPPCLHQFSMFKMNDNDDEVLVVTGDDDIKSDSSSERCELGVLPAYLDTITEEDTDDLNTNSSGRSSPKRINRISLNIRDLRYARDFLTIETKQDDDRLSISSTSSSSGDITTPSTPRNSNVNLNYLYPNNVSTTNQEHNQIQQIWQQNSPKTLSTCETSSVSPSSSTTINRGLQNHEKNGKHGGNSEEDIAFRKSTDDDDDEYHNTLTADQSCLSFGIEIVKKNDDDSCIVGSGGANAVDETINAEKKPSQFEDISSPRHSSRHRFENRPLNLNYSIVESLSSLLQERYGATVNSNSTKNYRQSSSLSPTPQPPLSTWTTSSTMEYDLRKASSRFERYGHIYKDAPKSGMEEFDPKSSAIRNNTSSTSLNTSTNDDVIRSEISKDDNNNKNDTDVDEKGKMSTQMASKNLNSTRDKNNSATSTSFMEKETGRTFNSQSIPTFQHRPKTTTTTSTSTATTTTTTETKATIHSTSLLSPTCGVCGANVYHSSGFKCRQCAKKVENNTASLSTATKKNQIYSNNTLISPNNGATTITNVTEGQLDDYNSNWSFSDDDEMSSTSTNGGHHGGLVIATATSKAIINDPAGQKRTSLIASASSNAVSKNPYVALARATASAASKVSEVVQHAVDPDQRNKVSLVVSSTVCATGRELKRASRENMMFDDDLSSSEPTPEIIKKHPRYHHSNGNNAADVHSSPVHWGKVSTKIIPHRRSPEPKSATVYQTSNSQQSSTINPSYFRREEVKMAYEPQPERIYPPTTLREVEPERKLIAPQHVSTDRLQKLIEEPYFAKAKSKEKLAEKSKSKLPTQASVPLSERNVNLWSTLPENSKNNTQNLMRWRNSMNLAENEELRALMELDQKQDENYAVEGRKSQLDEDEIDAKLEAKIIREHWKKSQEELDEEIRKIRRNKYKAKIDKAKKDYLASKASISDLYKDPEEFEKKFKVSIENVRLPEAPRGPFLEYLGKSGSLHTIKVADVKPYYYKPESLYDNEYESIVRQAERLWAPYIKRENAKKDHLYTNGRSMGYLETNFDAGESGLQPVFNGGVYETDLDEVLKDSEKYQQEHESRSRTKSMTEVKKKSRGEPIQSKKAQIESHVRARSADYLADRKAREEIEPPENQLKKILGDKDESEMSEHELRFRKSTEKLQTPDWYLNSEYCPSGKVDLSRKSTPIFNDRVPISSPSSPEMVTRLPHERPQTTSPSNQYLKHGQSPKTEHKAKYTDYPNVPVPKPSEPVYQPSEYSRYVNPWTYGGKIVPPPGLDKPRSPILQKPPAAPRSTSSSQNGSSHKPSRSISEPRSITSYEQKSYPQEMKKITKTSIYETKTVTTTKSPSVKSDSMYLPKDFFAKYKDEIEELRKSRSNLYGQTTNESNVTMTYRSTDEEYQETKKNSTQSYSSSQAYSVPVATVRPSNHLNEKQQDSSSLTSTDLSSGGTPPPAVSQSYKRNVSHQMTPQSLRPQNSGLSPYQIISPNISSAKYDDYSDTEIVTSTPFSGENISRPSYQQEDRSRYLSPSVSYQQQPRVMPGWTISAVPADWNVPGQRESVVIEVSDQFFDSALDSANKNSRRLGVPMTLEEALDLLLNLPTKGQRRLSTLDESSASLDTPVFPRAQLDSTELGNLGIYTHNVELMEDCRSAPENAEQLLKHETLWVRCAHCHRVRQLSDARYRFVSCHHCYTYYCNRSCRKSDWKLHKEQCNYARINTMCKDIIFKVRQDPEAQWQMSRVARQGYSTRGRGSVNFRFRSPYLAGTYVKSGWTGLNLHPGNYLNYYTVQELVDANKETNLINLCRRYDPQMKFILSVSIMAEIEEVPETPPPEREKAFAEAKQREMEIDDSDQTHHYESNRHNVKNESNRFERSRSVPNTKRKNSGSGKSSGSSDDAKTVLKSVLRSMENIAPGPVYISSAQRTANSVLPPPSTPNQSFDRSIQSRHTVAKSNGLKPMHYNSSPMVWSGPSITAGNEDVDESEV